jgi:hypothetical protein
VCAGDGAPPLFPLVRLLGPAPQVQAQDPEVTRDLRALMTVQGLHLLGQVVLTEGGNVEVLTRVEGCLSFRTSLDDGIQFIERVVPEIHQRPHHIRLDVPARPAGGGSAAGAPRSAARVPAPYGHRYAPFHTFAETGLLPQTFPHRARVLPCCGGEPGCVPRRSARGWQWPQYGLGLEACQPRL